MKIENVGVVLVHGIGEQRRFEHLDQQLRPLIQALREGHDENGDVTVEIQTAEPSANLAEQDTWRAGPSPAVRVIVREPHREIHIGVHEVWWADVNEPYSVMKQIRFWLWALTVWVFPPKPQSTHPVAKGRMATVTPTPCQRIEAQAKIFWVCTFYLMFTVTVGLAFAVLERVFKTAGQGPFTTTLVNYLSSIKLYNQKTRWGLGLGWNDADFLDAMGAPPRVSIRRRMISTLADVACANYDRWYVLAHSLGTIVAFNGLMEPGYTFPHYLDKGRWDRLQAFGLGGAAPAQSGFAPPHAGSRTLPERPSWLKTDDVAYRPQIFAKMRGFLTYGSPLGKFSAIWPALIPFCREPAFAKDSIWINVFDPLDPVSGPLRALDFAEQPPSPSARICCPPRTNVGYAGSDILLQAHVAYLTYSKKQPTNLVNLTAAWLLSDDPAPITAADAKPRFYKDHSLRLRARGVLMLVEWLVVYAAAPAIAGAIVQRWPNLVEHITEGAIGRSLVGPIYIWVCGAMLVLAPAIVFVAGIVARSAYRSDDNFTRAAQRPTGCKPKRFVFAPLPPLERPPSRALRPPP